MRVGKTGMYEPIWLFEKSLREHERFKTIKAMLKMDEQSLECFVMRAIKEDKHYVKDETDGWIKTDGRHEAYYKKAKQRLRQYIVNRLLEKEELLYFIDRHCDRQPEFYVRDGVKKCR